MNKEEYQNIYKNEDTHFYYVSLHKLILALLTKYSTEKKVQILDAGCGTGKLATLMNSFGDVKAFDFSDEAIFFAKKRGIAATRASVEKIPYKDNSFDVVTSIDVIYHKAVIDDISALKEMLRVLKPEGILILRVQAMPWLSLSHDKHVHGKRRYTKKSLTEKLKKAGYIIEKISYVHVSLFLLAIISHWKEKLIKPKKDTSSVQSLPVILNTIGFLSLIWEIPWLLFSSLPFGLGVVAVAKKRG